MEVSSLALFPAIVHVPLTPLLLRELRKTPLSVDGSHHQGPGAICVAQHHPHGFLSTSTAKTGFKAISSEHHRNMSTMFPVRICTFGLSAQPAENLSSRTTIHSSLPFCPRPSSVRTLLLHAIGTRTRCTTDVCRNGLESCPFWPTGLKIFIHCLFFWNARERLLVLQGPEKVEVCNFAQALL